ncbi:hypothetical protein ACFW04_001618 [Cataglyphis niger]
MKKKERLERDFTIRRDVFHDELRFERRSIETRHCDSRSKAVSCTYSTKLLEKLEKQREKQIEERKRHKSVYVVSKRSKPRKANVRREWANDYLHYTNTDNPFGDILSTFVWLKKLRKEGLLGVDRQELEMHPVIRIQDGRAKPIDLLAKYIIEEEEVDADLIEDIKLYKELEKAVCRREGIHESVAKDVITIFKGKTVTQLEALQLHIQTKIMGKLEDVDIGYWESLLSQLKAYMAKIRLRDGHQENLYKKLEVLIAEQGVVTAENETESLQTQESESLIKQEEPSTNAAVEKNENNQDMRDKCSAPERFRTYEEQAMHRKARKDMSLDEAEFSIESSLEAQIYLWSDKYRPPKPRYFNRVHTGFEWNKYNQTHYDMNNPPSKIVQGYKFNIFYPDLIDKNITPEYFLTSRSRSSTGNGIRISRFRCQFHNNIFQLWFYFKRYRYCR